MKGSPAKMGKIQGTAGHASALKMKAEADAASALKQKEERETRWWKGEEGWIPDELQPNVNRPKVKTEYGKKVEAEKKVTEKKATEKKPYVKKGGKATGSMKNYAIGSKERYDEYEARGWAHDDTTKGYKPAKAKSTKIEQAADKADKKVDKIKTKSAKKVAEVGENLTKKGAKYARKSAKKTYGKGSKEHLEAKKAHLAAKEADRQGAGGGKKQNIFRKLSSKINKKRQAKIDKKLAE